MPWKAFALFEVCLAEGEVVVVVEQASLTSNNSLSLLQKGVRSLFDGLVPLQNRPGTARLPRALLGDFAGRAVASLRQAIPRPRPRICFWLALAPPGKGRGARNQWSCQPSTSIRQA